MGPQQGGGAREAEHVQQLLATGVIALARAQAASRTHGASASASSPAAARVGRAADAAGDTDARADKGIDETVAISCRGASQTSPGAAAAAARRASIGDRGAAQARFGVWVGGDARHVARVLRRWRELDRRPPATPVGPSRSHTMPVRPSPVATGSSTAVLSTVGAERSAPLEKTSVRRRRSHSTRCRR